MLNHRVNPGGSQAPYPRLEQERDLGKQLWQALPLAALGLCFHHSSCICTRKSLWNNTLVFCF